MCRISVAPGVIGSFRNKLSDVIVGASSGEMSIYAHRDSGLVVGVSSR